MKFEFITTCDGYDHTIEFFCENLSVSKSGFYSWKKSRGARYDRDRCDYELVRKIEAIHLGSKRAYGSPRVHGILKGLEPDICRRPPSSQKSRVDLYQSK